MKRRNIGKSELLVSAVGLGCNNFGMRIDLEASRAVVHQALDLGITLFDTADIYGYRGDSEIILGQVLGNERKNVVLATKFGKPMNDARTMKGASRAYIQSAVESSLRRLDTDWIDLYQLHEPDPATPIEETLRALNDLVDQGKVRYIGCSNLPASQVIEAQLTAEKLGVQPFISCQDEYSLLVRKIERELIPVIEEHGLGLLPFFPLASGLLTGKYRRNEPAPRGTRMAEWKSIAERYWNGDNWNLVESLEKLCAERGHSLLELAFGWLLAKPIVSSVIAGATKSEQVRQNVAAAFSPLSPEDLADIERLLAETD